jgi:hypothetical protein
MLQQVDADCLPALEALSHLIFGFRLAIFLPSGAIAQAYG